VSATQNRAADVLVQRKMLVVTTETRRQAIDLRPQVEETVESVGAQCGLVLVHCLHTTCSVVVAELAADELHMGPLLGKLIPENYSYWHNDLRWSDCERGNAAAHLRASLLGAGVTVPIVESKLALEPSSPILLVEWDGPRSRMVEVRIVGS